jgi:predicted DNA-binding antitoxin AbrB/MazE fold protein
MKTVQAVFEDGVFRPIGEVTLPENSRVEFEPRVLAIQQSNAMLEAFEILSHSYETGDPDLAARHDEHQP